jgi:TP901 family phage tail tape measure protein
LANNITVGILRALLTLDTAQFHQGMRESAGSVKKFEGQMRKIGGNLTQIGGTLTGAVTLPIVAAFAGATKAAIDFESSFAGVRKTVDASEAEFATMSQQFRGLSKEIPVSVNELNRLGEAAGALGIPKAEIVDFSKVMAMLGVTTNVTADQAAESIAKIQNIFGASGKFTENFASTLVDLGNKGASTEAEILALATRIASAGNTVNMSQAQVLGFSSAIANVGMDAEAGGSAFSRVIIEMSKAVSTGGESLKGFAQVAGMSSQQFATLFQTNAAGAMQAFVEGLGRIKAGGGDLNAVLGELGFTEIRQSDLLRRLAGASDMVGLSLQTANSAWTQNTALQDEAGKRFATFQSQLTVFWNRLTDIGITLGTALLPLLTSFLNILSAVMPVIEFLANSFAAMPLPLQIMAVGFAGLVAAIGPILLILGQLAMGVAALTGIGGFAGLMTILTTVTTFITGGLTAAFTAILPWLGPIGLIAVGVGAVVLAWKYWDQIVAFFTGAWQFVVQSLQAVPSVLLPLLGPIGLVVAAFRHWDQIAGVAQAVYTAVKTWLIDKFNAIVESIRQKVAAVTGFFRDMYIKVVGQSYVPDMVSGIGASFGQLDGLMVNPAKQSTSLVTSVFQSMSDSVHSIVTGMLNRVSSMLTGWLDSFMPSWAANLLGGVAETVMGGLTSKLIGGGGGGGLGGLFGGGGGGGFGGGGGGLLGKIPGLGGLFGGGGAPALGNVNGITAGLGSGAGGAGGGGMGFLTNPAFWTNPFTLAAIGGTILGLGIWKKGWFRGGEEALKVSPRRDKFFAQFGDIQNRGEGGAAWNLASKLVALGQGEGGGPLFAALQNADTTSKWETAQASVVALLKRTGMEVQSFAQGGFIPPGMVTPAMLHGGSQGEIIAPLEKVGGLGSVVNVNIKIQAWDGMDVTRVVNTQVIPRLKQAITLNTGNFGTAIRGTT